jgi:hypothetical protein
MKLKNSAERFDRIGFAQERISELEGRSFEITQLIFKENKILNE